MRFVVQGARKGISFGFTHRPRAATYGEEAHVAARTRIPDVGDGETIAAVIEAGGCNAVLWSRRRRRSRRRPRTARRCEKGREPFEESNADRNSA